MGIQSETLGFMEWEPVSLFGSVSEDEERGRIYIGNCAWSSSKVVNGKG